ncbi:MAG: ribonuclease J, partial [bacterium]|nr:ribonuclease J [bacterium]
IKKRQDDFRDQLPSLRAVKTNESFVFGAFKVEFFMVSHNIPASLGLVIHTPMGILVHTGDFKFDLTPSGSSPTELFKIAALGDKNVLALIADSTNAGHSGYQTSEAEIARSLKDVIKSAPGRLIIGTFASLLGRIQQIIWIAEELGKKVIVQGFSLRTNLEIAQELGYVKAQKGTIITEWKEAKHIPDEKQLIICTGAQGEERAALMRIANKEHRDISIQQDDTVVFSSSVIPGNERTVQRLKDSLYRQGAIVVHYQMMDVHAGGHAKEEDLRWLIKLVNPRYHIPCEGHHSFLRLHAKIAESMGIPKENIFVSDNGQVIEFSRVGTTVVGKLTNERVPADPVMIDGIGAGNVDQVVLRDRQMLSEDGMIVIIATVRGKTGQLVGNPDIISRGFVHLKESKELIEQVRKRAKQLLMDKDPRSPAFEAYIKQKLRDDLGQFIFQKTERRPMILPVVIEV